MDEVKPMKLSIRPSCMSIAAISKVGAFKESESKSRLNQSHFAVSSFAKGKTCAQRIYAFSTALISESACLPPKKLTRKNLPLILWKSFDLPGVPTRVSLRCHLRKKWSFWSLDSLRIFSLKNYTREEGYRRWLPFRSGSGAFVGLSLATLSRSVSVMNRLFDGGRWGRFGATVRSRRLGACGAKGWERGLLRWGLGVCIGCRLWIVSLAVWAISSAKNS